MNRLAAGLVVASFGGFASPVFANDFPTQARVEYVLQCMNGLGGQSYDTLYPCVCMVDKIAAEMNYDDFSEGQAFTYLKSTPGERGGVFRDPPRAIEVRKLYEKAIAGAKLACNVKQAKN